MHRIPNTPPYHGRPPVAVLEPKDMSQRTAVAFRC
jgi:hypothetical protein